MTPQEIEETWRRKSDEEVLAAAEQLADYTEVGQRIILAEMRKRGIAVPLQSIDLKPVETEHGVQFAHDLKEAGRKNMMHGALWCIGGIIVTALTYRAAAKGGVYLIAWGAIVFGAIQFFRGLVQRFPPP